MSVSQRLASLREYLRGSLWVLPTASVLVAIVAGSLLGLVSIDAEGTGSLLLFGGGADGARAVLEAIAGSVITVTSVTFSLTVVALQMAASQYSPRLLRNFLRDRGNQTVLSVFLSTFAFSLTVLRTVRSPDGGGDEFVPRIGVTLAVLLALSSVGALVYFIHHLTQSMRVETVLRGIVSDTLRTAETNLDPARGEADDGDVMPPVPARAAALVARRGGYLQAVEVVSLVGLAEEHGVTLRLRLGVGAHVAERETLAWAWPSDGPLSEEGREAIQEALSAAVQVGNERTLQQDVAYGVRQLADVAVRAVSPSMNDPTTAAEALNELTVVLRWLAGRRLGPRVVANGSACVAVPYLGFDAYLGLACRQIAHYGSADLAVVRGLMRLLGGVAEAACTPERRDAVAQQLERVTEEADRQLPLAADRARANQDAEEVRRVLARRT